MLSTQIETMVLGDGLVNLGHNFAGTFNATNNAYLKNVYMSAKTNLIVDGSSKIFYKCANPVNFYIVGTNEECAEMVVTLREQSSGSYMTFITADEVTESTGKGYGIIYVGYNRCDAFYNSEHRYVSANDPVYCMAACSVCDKALEGAAEHSFGITEEFGGGKYISACTVTKYCTSCEYVASISELDALFVWVGYSVPEEPIGDTVGVAQCFKVNSSALAEYENITGKALQYGLVAAIGTDIAPVEIVDGNAEALNGAIMVPMENSLYDYFEIKIAGITSADFDTAIVFCSYVSDGKEVYYVNNGELSKTATGLSYNQIKPKN